MPKSKYKIIIFDLDDTLLESRVAKWAQHRHVAKKFYNIDLTHEDLLKHWGKPFEVLIQELYQHKDTLDNMYKAIYTSRHKFPKKAYKQSVSTINKLLDNNIKVGVLSATTNYFLKEDLIKFGFPIDKFSIIQGADESSFHKPDPKVFLPVIKKLEKEGINKNEIVYVGDSLDDFKAATGAGIDFIGVTTGLYTEKDFKKQGAEIVIKEIGEVVEIII